MKALADLNINLDSKAVAELLVSELLPGAFVCCVREPNVRHRVIGYNKEEEGVIITTTDDAYMPGWCSFTFRDMVVMQGYEEVRKVYEYLDMVTVSYDLANRIVEQVAAMEKETQYYQLKTSKIMKRLIDLDINLDSKEVVELLLCKLLPGALVCRGREPNVKHKVIGYNKKEKGGIIVMTDDGCEPGEHFIPNDTIVIQGYEEARRVYEYLEWVTVSDDLADYIEEKVATMNKKKRHSINTY